MEQIEERFYVKNLPPNVTEDDFKSFFASLGDIHDVVVKNNYGFFSAKGSSRALKKATFIYANKSWNGHEIFIEKAATESFMSRLAKEREALKKPVIVNGKSAGDATKPYKLKKKRRYSSSDNSDDGNSKCGVPKFSGTVGLYPAEKPTTNESDVMSKFSAFDAMWADGDDEQNKNSEQLSTILASGKPKAAKKLTSEEDKSVEKIEKLARNNGKQGGIKVPMSKLEKKKRDDDRRKLSLANKSKERQKQQSFIKSALSSQNMPQAKKIVFDSDEEEMMEKKKSLFDDDDDNEEKSESIIITNKEHFDSEKGHKLLKLQSQFNNDERFKMDKRFLEDDDGLESSTRKEKNAHSEMVRFDPTKREADNFKPVDRKSKKNLANTTEIQEVSKERFYQVSDTFTAAFKEKSSGFSLLAAYGKRDENQADKVVEQDVETVIKPIKVQNPLLTDSSDDEESGSVADVDEDKVKIWAPIVHIPSGPRDNFFFAKNDPLISDAMEFFNKKDSEEAKAARDGYDGTRRVLKKIFKDQAMKRSKENDMFKKKIGGMKKKIVPRNPFTATYSGKMKQKKKNTP